MSVLLAIKRSYHYFIPPSLLNPRRLVRQLFVPIFFYFVGLTTGMYTYVGPAAHDRVTELSIVGLLVLLVLRWWAGKPATDEQAET